MNTVGLVESRNSCHPAEQKWQQRDILPLCDFGKDRVKAPGVGHAEVRGCFHLNQSDLRPWLLRSHSGDQLLEIRARILGRETAKRVVRAPLDHDQIRRCAKHPVDASHRARGRLTRQAGIHHLDGNALRQRFFLDQRRKCLLRIQSEPGRETRAEEKNDWRAY